MEGGDYYSHTHHYVNTNINIDIEGYDFRDGANVDWSHVGVYSTYAYRDRAIEIIKSHNPSEVIYCIILVPV